MLENITLYSTLYYERSIFKGSYRGMNFRIQKAGEEEHPVLEAVAWKGPLIYDKTEEEKFTRQFEFSDEGIQAASRWLSEQQALLFGDIQH
ncbi:MAG: hypothetical protein J1F02_11925 [Lachnospiraceae bacterium]|nr:hypothetical protein [Lachnospiraceae bacterium]